MMKSIDKLMLAISLILVAATGCSSDCDGDQIYSRGLCFEAIPPSPDGGPPADARFAHYGDVCVDPGSCADPTDFCMIPIGTSSGYCTRTACTVDADCPEAWTCVDLSQLFPQLPHACLRP